MRIAVIIDAFPKLSETFVLYHIIGLLENGHSVHVFSSDEEKRHLIHQDAISVNYKSFTSYGVDRPNGISRIVKAFKIILNNWKTHKALLQSFNPFRYGFYGLKGYLFYNLEVFARSENSEFDIIHSHFGNNGIKGALAQKLGLIKGKHVVHFHGHDLLRDDYIQSYDNYSLLLKSIDGIVFNSDFLRSVFLKKFEGHEVMPFDIVHEPFNPERFPLMEDRIKSETSPFTITTVGRLVSWKGQGLVIDAIQVFREKFPEFDVRLNIVGDGEDFNALEEKIKSLNLGSIVNLTGSLTQDKVSAVLHDSDVFVLFGTRNSKGEIDTQGVVIQEASSIGLPVIISDAGGMKEGVLQDETGFIVPENDLNALVEKLYYLAMNPEKGREMGEKGHAYVCENFSYTSIGHDILRFYTTILNA